MQDPRKSKPFQGGAIGRLVIPGHPEIPNLSHLAPIVMMVRAGRHLLITGMPGAGKDITLNALLDLPEDKDYVTPALLSFIGTPGLPTIPKGQENDIAVVGHPMSGYPSFRREAARRHPNRPTACIVMDQSFRDQGGSVEKALGPFEANTVVVHLVGLGPQGVAAPLVGIRRLAEVLRHLKDGSPLREAVMGSSASITIQ